MAGAFWILLFTIALGIILYIGELAWRRKNRKLQVPVKDATPTDKDNSDTDGADGGECCGLHLTCEKDSLSPMSADIVYYDDEELDRFAGRAADSYTPEETEEFRDVLMTLLPEDVPGWARSITLRGLELPPDVRDELLMLVNEQRRNAASR